MRVFTILLLAGASISLTGLSSATEPAKRSVVSTQAPIQTVQQARLIKVSMKSTPKRRVVRKVLPTESQAIKVYSDKSLIDVAADVPSKSKILTPVKTNSRTLNLYKG